VAVPPPKYKNRKKNDVEKWKTSNFQLLTSNCLYLRGSKMAKKTENTKTTETTETTQADATTETTETIQADATTQTTEQPASDQTPTPATSEPTGETSSSTTDTTVTMPDLTKLVVDQLNGSNSSIDLLKDVELNVKIELGRTKMFVEDVLKLSEGAVVELDKLAGDPVDILVNEKLVARGEVLVLNDNFCVRINQIVADPA